MDANCSRCGKQVSKLWSFCPHCAAAIAPVSQVHRERPAPEHVPARSAFSGLYIGLIASPILVIVGTMLCLTGLGAFLGVPMIIAAVFAPLAGPMLGMGERKVRCPSCQTRMFSIPNAKGHECPVCNKKFAVEEHGLVQAG